MYRYRGFIFSFVVCLAAQLALFRVLEALGMGGLKIWTVEMAALCATVWITLGVGEHFEKKSGHRGD
jgi:hypothetical protein